MNSVFHPSGTNPFQLPPLPQSHYAPSPSKDILDKSATLTPQKPKHRHEYSIPPEVYTPEQYSIHEDDSTSSKPPLPSYDREDVVRNLQKYLNDVETWDSEKFCEKWPSKDSESKEDPPSFEVEDITDRSSTGPLTSTARSAKSNLGSATMKEKPIRMKTSFASDRNLSMDERTSNIQKRLNRFRYGEPKAPEERKKERAKLPTPSSTPKYQPQSSWKSSSKQADSNTKSVTIRAKKTVSPRKPKDESHSKFSRMSETPSKLSPRVSDSVTRPPLPPNPVEFSDLADVSASTLDSKLEKLLKETSSVMSSPLSTLKSTGENSLPGLRVSSDATTTSTEFEMSSKFVPQHHDVEPSRKMLWQKENVPSTGFHGNTEKMQKEDDILYQWRLRRKIEVARDSVAKNKGLFPPKSMHRSQAERPFAAEATEVLQEATSVDRISEGSPVSPRQRPHCYFPQCSGPSIPSPMMPQIPMQHRHPSCRCCMYLSHHDSQHSVCAHQSLPQDEQRRPVEKKDVAVGITEMVSIETQTGKSLIFTGDPVTGNDGSSGAQGAPVIKNPVSSGSSASFPHTSTPASSVSFHRVRIVEAEPENSPQTTKGSPQARNVSPVSCKTDATTLWSSTDHKKTEENRSPASSVRTSERKFASDTDTSSPTGNVVKEVIGAHLFNTSQTPSSASAVSRLKDKKKCGERKKELSTSEVDNLNGSYTTSDFPGQETLPKNADYEVESKEEKQESLTAVSQAGSDNLSDSHSHSDNRRNVLETPIKTPTDSSSSVVKEHEIVEPNEVPKPLSPDIVEEIESNTSDEESDFDPDNLFDELLEEMEFDEIKPLDETIIQELKSEKSLLLKEFRDLEDEIEEFGIMELENCQRHDQ